MNGKACFFTPRYIEKINYIFLEYFMIEGRLSSQVLSDLWNY